MAACLENILHCDVGCSDFEHIFFENEMVTPESFYILFKSWTKRSKIEETSDSSVYFESWNHKEFSFEKIFNLSALVFYSEVNCFGLDEG